jgi:hypothetical protein
LTAPLVPLVILLVLVGLGAFFVFRLADRRQERTVAVVEDHEDPTLRYHVPDGVDMAGILATLQAEGYEVVSDMDGTHDDLLIVCRSGEDRERAHVRAAIAHATNPEGDPVDLPEVRFADEPAGPRP